jgi:hypothetical protein
VRGRSGWRRPIDAPERKINPARFLDAGFPEQRRRRRLNAFHTMKDQPRRTAEPYNVAASQFEPPHRILARHSADDKGGVIAERD